MISISKSYRIKKQQPNKNRSLNPPKEPSVDEYVQKKKDEQLAERRAKKKELLMKMSAQNRIDEEPILEE